MATASLKAQIFFNNSVDTFSKDKLNSIMEQSFRLKDSFDLINYDVRMDIFDIKSELFLIPDGRFDVFEWKNERWHNRYASIYYGYNFHSRKFVYNDDLYSFGGYGYWRTHGDLIKFMWNQNTWSFINYDKMHEAGNGISY